MVAQQSITPDALNKIKQAYNQSDPYTKATSNALSANDAKKLTLNRDNIGKTDSYFKYKVKVKGKNKPVIIYEILNGNSERIIELKLSTKKEFETGVDLYLEEKFEDSAIIFKNILKKDPKDTAVSLYLERAKYYSVHGVPENWEGAWKLDSK